MRDDEVKAELCHEVNVKLHSLYTFSVNCIYSMVQTFDNLKSFECRRGGGGTFPWGRRSPLYLFDKNFYGVKNQYLTYKPNT